MPSIKRRLKRERREWIDSHLRQLSCGWDFLHDAFGDITDLAIEQRMEWPLPEAREQMRECWDEHRDELMTEDRNHLPFAYYLFEEGLSGRDAIEAAAGRR